MPDSVPADGTYYVVQYREHVDDEWTDYCKGGPKAALKVVDEMKADPKSNHLAWRAVEVYIVTKVMDW